MKTLQWYTRTGCSLCERGLDVVQPLVAQLGMRMEVVDIELDDGLHRRYLELIPVLADRDRVILKLDEFERPDLGSRLAKVARCR